MAGPELGKDFLHQNPEFAVRARGASDLHKWLTAYHNATLGSIPLGEDLSSALIIGDIDICDGLLKKLNTILSYSNKDLDFEFSTYFSTEKPSIPMDRALKRTMLPASGVIEVDMPRDPSMSISDAIRNAMMENMPQSNLDFRKIQAFLAPRLQPLGYQINYQQIAEFFEFLDIKKVEEDDQNDDLSSEKPSYNSDFGFHPLSPTDYCFHLKSDPQQPQEAFEENYQLYATMLGHVVNAVYESEQKLPPTRIYELEPQRNIDSVMQRMTNRITMQKGMIRSAGINVFGEETTDTDDIGKINPENMKNISFDDIGGHEEAKKLLRLGVLGLTHPEKFTEQGAIPPTKFLLNGPTGTGKTSLAIATAREAGVPTYSMQVGNILRSLVGASEQRVRDTFAQARKDGKAVVILDELDAIARSRESYMHGITTTLMTELDGIADNSNILVIGTTNLREIIDPGMLRAGRFNHIIDITLPKGKDLERIFAIHMGAAEKRAQRRLFSPEDIKLLTEDTAGLSGADIEEIVKRVVNQRVMEKEFLGIEPPEYETAERILQKIEEYDPVRKGKGSIGLPTPHKIKPLSN